MGTKNVHEDVWSADTLTAVASAMATGNAYSVPEWLDDGARILAGMPYVDLEREVWGLVRERWNTTLPIGLLRSFCVGMLMTDTDPLGVLERVPCPIGNLVAYLSAIITRRGRTVASEPPTIVPPVTTKQYPWEPRIPTWDLRFAADDGEQLAYYIHQRWGLVFPVGDVDVIGTLREQRAERREKALEQKLAKWGEQRKRRG